MSLFNRELHNDSTSHIGTELPTVRASLICNELHKGSTSREADALHLFLTIQRTVALQYWIMSHLKRAIHKCITSLRIAEIPNVCTSQEADELHLFIMSPIDNELLKNGTSL